MPRKLSLFVVAAVTCARSSQNPPAGEAIMASGGDGPASMPHRPNLLLEREAPPLLTREDDFDPQDFSRQDESDDGHFYSQERFVTHIDDTAIEHLTAHYAQLIYRQRQAPGLSGTRKIRVLDVCSSWISHLPPGDPQLEVVGLGMSEGELGKNPQLSSYVVMNLNAAAADPAVPLRLPFDSGSFDLVVNSVSVDYLARPLAVFRELHRVLRPGTGVLANTFSNRFFPTKVIRRWYRASDMERLRIVGSYFAATSGIEEGGTPMWLDVGAYDLNPAHGRSDPLWAVQARKGGGGGSGGAGQEL